MILHCVMSLRPIAPVDSRVEHKTAVLNGYSYHYLYGVPPGGKFKATIFLVSSSFTRWLMQTACNAVTDCATYPICRFMAGPTSVLDGDTRYPCCLTWGLGSWLQT